MTCGRFWRARAENNSKYMQHFKRYKIDLIRGRKDCAFVDCCSPDQDENSNEIHAKIIDHPDEDFNCWMFEVGQNRGICQARLDIEDRQGRIQPIVIALDTASNRDLCLGSIAKNILDRTTMNLRVFGGSTRMGPLATVRMVKPDRYLDLKKVRVGRKEHLPSGCQLLLGRTL